jgi:ElaB/YqjD/DUF883 family membrane-anchored ribosome-binding protein
MKAQTTHPINHRGKVRLLLPQKMRRRIKTKADDFIDRSLDIAENAKANSENYLRGLSQYAKKHPMRIMAFSAAAGLVLGVLLRR